MTWFAVAVGSIVVLALASYASFLATRYFFVARFPDEIQFGTTADGLTAFSMNDPAVPAVTTGASFAPLTVRCRSAPDSSPVLPCSV